MSPNPPQFFPESQVDRYRRHQGDDADITEGTRRAVSAWAMARVAEADRDVSLSPGQWACVGLIALFLVGLIGFFE